jgi:hypothetical protein
VTEETAAEVEAEAEAEVALASEGMCILPIHQVLRHGSNACYILSFFLQGEVRFWRSLTCNKGFR